MRFSDVMIVGAGHAGAHAAVALRQARFAGSIVIVGDEKDLPYERPPLSKDYLTGNRTLESLLLRPPDFWEQQRVSLVLGKRVTHVDAVGRLVRLENGDELQYGAMIWAAGGRARRLSCTGHDLKGVHSVRTRADVDQLKSELASANRAVVIGGGYIGLESAAALITAAKKVVLLETLDRVLARVAGKDISAFYEAEHRARGVDVRTRATVNEICGIDGRVTGVSLTSGEVVPADIAIVGIGIVPNIEPLVAAGAESGNGLIVNEYCQTSLPSIYAIGDCAAHINAYAGGARIRLESVQNANDQATTAARAISGTPAAYGAVPWFWSNQYDLRLQSVGLTINHDRAVLRGDPRDKSFSVIYLNEGCVVALDCVNAAKDYINGRRLVAERSQASEAILQNTAVDLKTLLSTAMRK